MSKVRLTDAPTDAEIQDAFEFAPGAMQSPPPLPKLTRSSVTMGRMPAAASVSSFAQAAIRDIGGFSVQLKSK